MVKGKNNLIAALDIGSSKIACFIAEHDALGNIAILGVGHNAARGIKAGTITDIYLAEESIRLAVGSAEKMAGRNIESVIINISGHKQKSNHIKVEMPLPGQEVESGDAYKLIDQSCAKLHNQHNEIIHCTPISYSIDGSDGIENPNGMFGNILGCDLHIVTASSSTIMNFANCIAKCHLDVDDYIASPYASAYSCLSDDEKKLGVVAIDFGANSTSFAIFKDNKILHLDTIMLGGFNVTKDIALGLSTSIENAERIKTLYGSALSTAKTERQMIDVMQITESSEIELNHIPRSALIDIMIPRIEEIFELLRDKIKLSGYNNSINKIIITGGSSQIVGLKEFASNILHKPVRLGLPAAIDLMTENYNEPNFATCVGMLQIAVRKHLDPDFEPADRNLKSNSVAGKILHWLKENF